MKPATLILACFLLITLYAMPTTAQQNGSRVPAMFVGLDHADYDYAHTTKSENYMGAPEKEVVRWINLARVNGPLFASRVLLVHRPDSTHPAVASLLQHLRNLKPMEPLQPQYQLYKSASAHASDLGFSGRQGTESTNGQPYYDRIHQYVPGAPRYAEVVNAGTNTPLDIALALLMDSRDEERLTRRALLSQKLQMVGCSIRPHRSQCYITVIDMVAQPVARRSNMPELAMDQNAKKEHYGWAHCPKGSKVAPVKAKKRSFWSF
jgi:hypothetical protein